MLARVEAASSAAAFIVEQFQSTRPHGLRHILLTAFKSKAV